ncbi:hypothetical protein B296_00050149 [Ensete ventricosum]|uniref:Uncharacterized protein n=1 Tax=Ensete ventricosum TaxID=4639 RepID=A0A426YGM2_ENSVE|nr:hypothetical protein B296_00050149 [Ensete ventricosum]
MSSSGSSSVRVVPSPSSKGTRSEDWETSILGSSHSGIPSPEDARSQRNLEVMKSYHDIASVISEEALESIRGCYIIPEGYVEGNPSPFPGDPRYDREVVGRGRAQSSFSGYTFGPEGAQPEVEVTHAEASAKRPAGSPVPNQTVAGRPEKQVKIAVRKHKSHRDDGSSHRATREREPEVSMEDSSPTYRWPKSMRDLCGMQVREDDEGYYVLQMVDWASRDSSE